MSLVTVPLVLGGLGAHDFGLYSFLLGVVSFVGLLQAGLNVAVARSVAAHHASGDDQRLTRELQHAYRVSLVAGALQAGALVGVPLVGLADDPAESSTLAQLGAVFAVSAVGNAAGMVPRGILVGLERFPFVNALELVPLLAGLAAAVAIRWGAPLSVVGYAVAVEGARLLITALYTAKAHALLPHPFPGRVAGRFDAAMSRFQAKQMGNQLSDVLFYTADRIVLQTVLGAVAVAHYAIAERPHMLASNLVSMPLAVIIPPLAAAYAQGDDVLIRRMFGSGTREYCAVTLPLLVTLVAMLPQLVSLWVGDEFRDSVGPARVLVACLVISVPFKVYSHLRLTEGTIGPMVAAKLLFAPVNVVASYLLCQRIGLVGVVLPTATFFLVILPGLWIASMMRRGELRRFADVLRRPLAAAALHGALAWVVTSGLPPSATIWTLPLAAALAVAGIALFSTIGGATLPIRLGAGLLHRARRTPG